MERLVSLVENCSKSMEALNARLDTMSSSLRLIEKRLGTCENCGANAESALETGHCDDCTRPNKSPRRQ